MEAFVKDLDACYKIEETLLELQLTLNADVDSGRIVGYINNAKEAIINITKLRPVSQDQAKSQAKSQCRRKVNGAKLRPSNVVRQAGFRLANGFQTLNFGSIRVSTA